MSIAFDFKKSTGRCKITHRQFRTKSKMKTLFNSNNTLMNAEVAKNLRTYEVTT